MSTPTDEHLLLCRIYGPAPWVVQELTPPVSDFSFWRDRMHDRRGEVVFGFVTSDGVMLLTRGADYPPGVFRIPSGGIHYDETAVDALYRELAEELGLTPHEFAVLRYAGAVEFRFASNAGTLAFPSYCFLLSQVGGDAPPAAKGRLRLSAETAAAGEIEDCCGVSRGRIGQVLADLGALVSPWDDWGRYRARSGQLVAQAWHACCDDPAQPFSSGPGSAASPGPRLLDLSLVVSPAMACYPGDQPPRRRLVQQRGLDAAGAAGEAAPGWEVSEWTVSSHAGTHVDAPSHLFPGAETVDQIELGRLIGPAVVVDCRRAAASARPVAVEDLPPPACLRGRVVLIRLGGPACFDSGGSEPDHVGISGDAAKYLAGAGILALGVDSLSVDAAGSGHAAHAALLGVGIPVIEGLDLRAARPGTGWRFAGQPLRLAGAEAAPCRAVLWRDAGPGTEKDLVSAGETPGPAPPRQELHP